MCENIKLYGSKNDVTVGNAHAQGAGDRDGYFQRIPLCAEKPGGVTACILLYIP